MFHTMTPAMLDRMQHLEARDAADRIDGTPHRLRLRQVPPASGRFLAILAASAPPGSILEIGTSAGYSTLWLALAAQAVGRTITTFEVSEDKIPIARETFALAGVDSIIELVHADAREHLARFSAIGFCFLDAEKSLYSDCYEGIVARLVPGGMLLADNVISHQAELQPFVDHALADPRVDAVVVPIGQGMLLCRRG